MLHNRSILVMAAIAAVGYFLYTRLDPQEKEEIKNDLKQRTDNLVNDYIASENKPQGQAI